MLILVFSSVQPHRAAKLALWCCYHILLLIDSSLNISFLLFFQPEKDFWAQGKARVVDSDVIHPEKEYIFGEFSERLWAYLTIQQLLENRFDPLKCVGQDSTVLPLETRFSQRMMMFQMML